MGWGAGMIIAIVGTRECKNVQATVESAWCASPWFTATPKETLEIISGGSGDVDREAELFARRRKIVVTTYMADWDAHGRAAGPMRNKRMAEKCDATIAIWDGWSIGTLNMITNAIKLGKPVFIWPIAQKKVL